MALKWWQWCVRAKRAFRWRWLLSLDLDDRVAHIIEEFRKARDEALSGHHYRK